MAPAIEGTLDLNDGRSSILLHAHTILSPGNVHAWIEERAERFHIFGLCDVARHFDIQVVCSNAEGV